MAIAMFSQVAVLLKLNGLEIPLLQNSGRHWLWAELLVCFLGASAAFTTASLFQERRLTGNLAAGIGCVLAWAYYLLMEPFAYFVSEQSSALFVLRFFLLLPIATILSLRDVFVELKALGRNAVGSRESRPKSLNTILRRLEETEYFIPALYVQGTSLLVLLFLASLDKPFSFTANLGNSTAEWSENSFYLLLAAGVLSISAAVLRNSARTASGIIALQGALAGFWFGFIVFRATVNAVFLHSLAPKSGSADSAGGVGGTILLALFFLPLVFTFSYSVKDLLETENAAAILMRLMAGCCDIVLLRLFQWREVGLSVAASLFLIGGFLGYVLAAVHPAFVLLVRRSGGLVMRGTDADCFRNSPYSSRFLWIFPVYKTTIRYLLRTPCKYRARLRNCHCRCFVPEIAKSFARPSRFGAQVTYLNSVTESANVS
jgi:hypothetical protein